jgi:hypothetical protein
MITTNATISSRARVPCSLGPCAAALLFALAAAACHGGGQQQVKLNKWGQPLKAGKPPPPWVQKIPESTKDRVVTVGFSGPTFWPQDAMNNASEDARGKLAMAMSSKVEKYTQVGAAADSQHALDITKEATDVVMQNSRIDAIWVDEAGQLNEPGSAWAMAVLDKSGASIDAGGKDHHRSPGWLDRLPSTPARLYAAGYCGATFRPDDAVQYASDAAVTNLAASLRSHVQAYNLVVATTSGQSVDDFAKLDDPEKEFIELVRKKAKIEQIWVDKDGVRPGDPPGSVWALAGIDVGSTKGGAEQQQNQYTGPALDAHGDVK